MLSERAQITYIQKEERMPKHALILQPELKNTCLYIIKLKRTFPEDERDNSCLKFL
jgi:hypothetical protein